jgi:anaerobic carbon-monoxide dehydrogenase iron sulfur subunit
MHKALLIDPEKCTSCLQCELACSFEKEGVFNPARSRIKIFEFEHGARAIPYTCTQCAEAWCLHACPVEALTRNPLTNAVELAESICVGCKVCTIACPFGTVNYNEDNAKVAKCDSVRRRPGLRQGVSDRRHHVCRCQLDRLRAHAG